MAQPFDDRKVQLAGDLFPVAERVSFGSVNNFMLATASSDGVLLFQSGRSVQRQQVAWFDRSGKSLGAVGQPAAWGGVSLAPDEKSAALSRFNEDGAASSDIWLYEFSRATPTRFTFHPSLNLAVAWSPKGDRIAFSSARKGAYDLYWKAANGTGQDELLLENRQPKAISQWSRDGKFIVYSELDSKTRQDLYVLPVGDSERKPVAFLKTEFGELQGQISPDSHWMAYTSDESGHREIYVRVFPSADGKWKVSTEGGEEPRWRADGKEIFYLGPDHKLFAVPVKALAGPKAAFEPGAPVPLFDTKIDPAAGSGVLLQYDVTADGKRFLMVSSNTAAGETAISVVVNWQPRAKAGE